MSKVNCWVGWGVEVIGKQRKRETPGNREKRKSGWRGGGMEPRASSHGTGLLIELWHWLSIPCFTKLCVCVWMWKSLFYVCRRARECVCVRLCCLCMIPVVYEDKRRDDETKQFSSLICLFAFKCIYSDGCSLEMSVWMCVCIYRSAPLGGLTCKITSSILLGQKSPSVFFSLFCLVFILLPRWVFFSLCLLCLIFFSLFLYSSLIL